jgi:hypothetical protein
VFFFQLNNNTLQACNTRDGDITTKKPSKLQIPTWSMRAARSSSQSRSNPKFRPSGLASAPVGSSWTGQPTAPSRTRP